MTVPAPPASAIVFVDQQHGWAGGRNGLVGTADGGKTLRVESRSPIVGLSAVGPRRAWALTGDGFVLHTSDGVRWSTLGAPHLFRVRFVDARHGFGLTRDGVVVKSSDGGRSWPQLQTPGLMQSECFSGLRTGWIARGGSVWTTLDGGASWRRRRLQPDSQGYPRPELGCRGKDVWVLLHGGAAASHEGYDVFRSRDAGATWRHVLTDRFTSGLRLPSIGPYSGPFAVLGRGRAVFVGSCAPCGDGGTTIVVRTSNGGKTFARTTPFHGGYAPAAVSFVDARHGWLLTSGSAVSASPVRRGIVWRTTDGGRRWTLAFGSPLVSP